MKISYILSLSLISVLLVNNLFLVKQSSGQSYTADNIEISTKKLKELYSEKPYLLPYNRGIHYFSTNRPNLALDEFNKALKHKPDHQYSYIYKGFTLLHLNRTAPALEQLEQAEVLGEISDNYKSKFFYAKGICQASLKKVGESIVSFEKSIAADKQIPDAYYALANIYFDRSNWIKAEEYIEHGLVIDPQNDRYWGLKSGIKFAVGDTKAGCEAAKKSCELGNCTLLNKLTICTYQQ